MQDKIKPGDAVIVDGKERTVMSVGHLNSSFFRVPYVRLVPIDPKIDEMVPESSCRLVRPRD